MLSTCFPESSGGGTPPRLTPQLLVFPLCLAHTLTRPCSTNTHDESWWLVCSAESAGHAIPIAYAIQRLMLYNFLIDTAKPTSACPPLASHCGAKTAREGHHDAGSSQPVGVHASPSEWWVESLTTDGAIQASEDCIGVLRCLIRRRQCPHRTSIRGRDLPRRRLLSVREAMCFLCHLEHTRPPHNATTHNLRTTFERCPTERRPGPRSSRSMHGRPSVIATRWLRSTRGRSSLEPFFFAAVALWETYPRPTARGRVRASLQPHIEKLQEYGQGRGAHFAACSDRRLQARAARPTLPSVGGTVCTGTRWA